MAPIEFRIREAQPEDIDGILALIVELAVFEREPDAVHATPALLHKNLFGPNPHAHALVAFRHNPNAPGAETEPPIGLALYFFNFSTWLGRPGLYLEDLYVSQTLRKSGLGTQLLQALAKVAVEKGCGRMEWSVLKWNEPAIRFYEDKLRATRMEEWVGMRLCAADGGIARLATLGTPADPTV